MTGNGVKQTEIPAFLYLLTRGGRRPYRLRAHYVLKVVA